MKVCAIVFKPCWQDPTGRWMSNGGYPLQMAGIASLFDETTLVVARRETPGEGGIPLPEQTQVVVLRSPTGKDLQRRLSFLVNIPYYVRNLVRVISRADVVHVPPPGDIPILGLVLALLMRKKLIVRYAGSWRVNEETTSFNMVARTMMRLFAGARSVMFATGEGAPEPGRNITWLFSTAVSEAELHAISPDCDRGLNAPPRIGYIGRLSREKGVENLVQAIAQLKRNGTVIMPEVVIIGDGPERESLCIRTRELGLEGTIRFTGQLDRGALSATLRTVDFCVQPSLTEGYSKAWLDAFAHGLPVLASEVGAARSVIGHNEERGWLVPPGDVQALANVLSHVLTSHVHWRSLRERCRRYAETRTIEAWAQRIGTVCAQHWDMQLVDGKIREGFQRG